MSRPEPTPLERCWHRTGGKPISCPSMGRLLLINPKSRFLLEGSHGNWAAKIKYLSIWKRCWRARPMQGLGGKQSRPAPSTWLGRGLHPCPAALLLPPHLARLAQAESCCPAIALPISIGAHAGHLPPLHLGFRNRNCRARGPLLAIAPVVTSTP